MQAFAPFSRPFVQVFSLFFVQCVAAIQAFVRVFATAFLPFAEVFFAFFPQRVVDGQVSAPVPELVVVQCSPDVETLASAQPAILPSVVVGVHECTDVGESFVAAPSTLLLVAALGRVFVAVPSELFVAVQGHSPLGKFFFAAAPQASPVEVPRRPWQLLSD